MQMAGQVGTIDMFLNFPIMDMNRNAFLWKPELADPDDIARMTRFWGDDSWRQVAWADSKQPDMFRVTELEKQPNKVIAEIAWRPRLARGVLEVQGRGGRPSQALKPKTRRRSSRRGLAHCNAKYNLGPPFS